MELPEHGVVTVFVELPNTKIELLLPLGESSPIAKFLEKNASGGIHHVCYEVEDILAARDRLKAEGARVLGDGEPRITSYNVCYTKLLRWSPSSSFSRSGLPWMKMWLIECWS